MNGTQISDTQRNNRTALTGHTIEALIVVVFYACRFIRGERSLGYFLVITALALIPVILGPVSYTHLTLPTIYSV